MFIYSEYVKKHIKGFEIFILKETDLFITNNFGPKNVSSMLCVQLWYVICFLMVLLFRITKHL